VTSDALRQGKHLTRQRHKNLSHNRFISDTPNIRSIKTAQKNEPKIENEGLSLLK